VFRLGLGLALTQSAYAGLHPFSATLIARMTVAPSAARVGAIDKLVRALVDAGVWARLDLLHMLAAHDSQAARINWVAPSYDLAAYNSPLFAANRGFKGDGTSAWMEVAGYNPSAGGAKFALNDASMGAWVLTPASVEGVDVFTGSGRLGRRYATSDHYHQRINDTPSGYGPGGSVGGWFAADRPDAATRRRFLNGALVNAEAIAASTNASYLRLFSTGSGSWSNAELSSVFAGASLTDAQHAALYAAIRTYLLAVGAITE
jgi:hypothetical protein